LDVAELQQRLAEAEETLRAIGSGEVDAVIVQGPDGERVYTLDSADRPYRLMVERMQEGALTIGADRTIYYCNVRFAEMLGLTTDKLVGRRLDEFTPADQLPNLVEVLEGAVDTSTEILIGIGSARIPVKVSAARIEHLDESTHCVVVTDLSEQKERERLVADHERKDQFIATLAHELRNPLAPIGYALEILRSREGKVGEEALHELLEIIARQHNHMRRLVDDLLDVARITRGAMHLERTPVDLRFIVRHAIEAAQPILAEQRHDVQIHLGAKRLMVDADPVRLGQVFENLLTNAAKYTPPGGAVDVHIRHERGWAAVSVSDTGSGIAPEFLPRMFQLFEQADRTLDRARGGLGLGLALVKRLVAMHGGRVRAESAGIGHGSTFTVELPIAEPQERASRPSREVEGRRTQARRLLIVDDNRDAAVALALLLKSEGHEIHVAYDGERALELARQVRPEAVLLDLGLPGIDGFEVGRRLRSEFGSELLLVAVTGYGQEQHRTGVRDAGFDRHLIKPVTLECLREAICDATVSGQKSMAR
jgi:PAS domain S-box-containing protein